MRERTSDIPYLADHFVDRAAETLGKKRPTVPKELYTLLSNYSFPGNVRELEGMMFDAVSVHARGVLSLESIRAKVSQGQSARERSTGTDSVDGSAAPLGIPEQFPTMDEAEEYLIREALRRADGNQTIAANLLGLSRRALNNRLQRSNPKKKR